MSTMKKDPDKRIEITYNDIDEMSRVAIAFYKGIEMQTRNGYVKDFLESYGIEFEEVSSGCWRTIVETYKKINYFDK